MCLAAPKIRCRVGLKQGLLFTNMHLHSALCHMLKNNKCLLSIAVNTNAKLRDVFLPFHQQEELHTFHTGLPPGVDVMTPEVRAELGTETARRNVSSQLAQAILQCGNELTRKVCEHVCRGRDKWRMRKVTQLRCALTLCEL